eukprot:Tamp_33335.p1 GENE.Tamp_33335~~Tamp_33335.p1  ORF type:complete len:135 (+),score=21.90 Tamp_33335:3-407(+)
MRTLALLGCWLLAAWVAPTASAAGAAPGACVPAPSLSQQSMSFLCEHLSLSLSSPGCEESRIAQACVQRGAPQQGAAPAEGAHTDATVDGRSMDAAADGRWTQLMGLAAPRHDIVFFAGPPAWMPGVGGLRLRR